MKEPAEYLVFNDRTEWRAWLEEHHTEAKEAWLVHYKKHPTLTLDAAVEEALCFGWIDSLLKKLDDKRYVLRYSPRRPKSIWSERNKQRVRKLIREGRMTEAGLRKIAEAKENGQWKAAARREQLDRLPPELEEALRKRKGARAAYEALTASRKKQLLYWLSTAKRPETKQRRIDAILDEVAPGS